MPQIFTVTINKTHPLSNVQNGSLIGKKVVDPIFIKGKLQMISEDIDSASKGCANFQQRSNPELVPSIHRAIENFCLIDPLILEEISRSYVLSSGTNPFVSCCIDDYDPLYSEAIKECGQEALKLKANIEDFLSNFKVTNASRSIKEFVQKLRRLPKVLEEITAVTQRFGSMIDTAPKYSL